MDITDLMKFYSSPLGKVAQSKLGDLIQDIWPAIECDTLVCHGFTLPVLDKLSIKAQHLVLFMDPHIGATYYLPRDKNVTALVESQSLPLNNKSTDRIILLHSLEHCANPRLFLREIWRVLSPEGRAIIITPNRRSLWAQLSHTPFGHGHSYSMGQLSHLLKDNQFDICQKKRALFVFPSEFWNSFLTGHLLETFNKTFAPKFSGVVAIEVKKQVYCGTLANVRKRLLITPSPIRAKLSSREGLG
ncbi:class I SAM-dependent methyltransferase [Candidatus Odyssella thessalonicensis]|uniref:class I SAM-dependent methyltransferase n=1 Tax=Candidatus Odyssella thessalonicensis TaxID=84647 RepID=UPI000A014225|nr:class I SAM-dependent methyltransferase [Candidatus Odyssella thessalonicensis]